MADLILAVVIIAILGGAIAYIVRAKRSGVKCIGCPASGKCKNHCSGSGNGEAHECNCTTK